VRTNVNARSRNARLIRRSHKLCVAVDRAQQRGQLLGLDRRLMKALARSKRRGFLASLALRIATAVRVVTVTPGDLAITTDKVTVSYRRMSKNACGASGAKNQ
jgi:hypothetical protein